MVGKIFNRGGSLFKDGSIFEAIGKKHAEENSVKESNEPLTKFEAAISFNPFDYEHVNEPLENMLHEALFSDRRDWISDDVSDELEEIKQFATNGEGLSEGVEMSKELRNAISTEVTGYLEEYEECDFTFPAQWVSAALTDLHNQMEQDKGSPLAKEYAEVSEKLREQMKVASEDLSDGTSPEKPNIQNQKLDSGVEQNQR